MKTLNHLHQETSLYLRQHAENPVDWHPWNAATLEKARSEKKPILLSIGYSACHWCHVMAHESFENAAIAAIMNQHFINIKVDKEERPDLDKIYQTSLQLLTRRTGGWPLTMFLHYEDLMPFFGGTYFPPVSKFGMPAFPELLDQVARYFNEEQDAIIGKRASFHEALQELLSPEKPAEIKLNADVLDKARHQLGGSYDPRFSGFGQAPKFPHPQNIERLLFHWYAHRNDKGAYNMPLETLRTLARSGIYDQLGGGFFRYSVDEQWQIPHFEKMLYDNALLINTYALAYQITAEPLFSEMILDITQWLTREMSNHQGAFYASIDADSEGKEGQFYVWTTEQIRELLSTQEFEVLANYYGLYNKPNFEERYWHLHASADFSVCCENNNLGGEPAQQSLKSAKNKLFTQREARIKPKCDTKILTSWNSLLATGLLRASIATHKPTLRDAGLQILEFINTHLWVEGELFAVFDGEAPKIAAFLDDYAFLLEALLTALQVTWRNDWLRWATQLANIMLDHFEDKQQGGFYFTANKTESLLARPKPLMDEAIPSGNAIASLALLRLGYLLGDERYLTAAQRSLEYAFTAIAEIPFAFNSYLTALEEYFTPPEIIILRGSTKLMQQKQAALWETFSPHQLVFCIPADTADLPQALAIKKPRGELIGYSCVGMSCRELEVV